MRRTIAIYSLVLVGALYAAYWTWTHQEQLDLREKIIILPGDADTLESIQYKDDKLEVTLTANEDALGRYMWVRAVPLESSEEEDTKEPPNPHAPPRDDGEPAEFKAGKQGETVVAGLTPFVAKRVLEGVTEDKFEELGLLEPATLTIARIGKPPKTFELGKAGSGGANVYVRDTEDGKIYLVDDKVIRPLRNAKGTLRDDTLFDVPTKDIKQLAVSDGTRTAKFDQHNPDDAKAMFWSSEGEAEANPTAAAWIDKALRLRSSAYIPEGDEPQGLEQVYTIASLAADGHTTKVAVYRSWGDEGEDEWFARSEHTRGLVKLRRAAAAEAGADLSSVFDGAPPEGEEPAGTAPPGKAPGLGPADAKGKAPTPLPTKAPGSPPSKGAPTKSMPPAAKAPERRPLPAKAPAGKAPSTKAPGGKPPPGKTPGGKAPGP